MQKSEGTTTYVALDLETRPDPLCTSIVGSRGSGGGGLASRAALHRVVAAAALIAHRTPLAGWSGFQLMTWDIDDGSEHAALVEIGTLLGDLDRSGGCLVTYNGSSHDLPILRRRAAAHWLFDLGGLSTFIGGAGDRHIDMMTDVAGEAERWPSLRDACASIAVELTPSLAHPAIDPLPKAVRKAQCDVVGTFILLLHKLALDNRSLADVARGWVALASALRKEHGHLKHLESFHTHSRIAIARDHLDRVQPGLHV